MNNSYAQVVLGVPVDKPFTYIIPPDLKEVIKIGQRVEVPFGQRKAIGYVVAFTTEPVWKELKPISNILGEAPLLDSQMLRLTRQVADYYCVSWGEAIEAAYPANIRKRKKTIIEKEIAGLDVRDIVRENNEEKIALNLAQQGAVNLVAESIKKTEHRVFLLYGVTASGKTEVYLQAIEYALAQGKTSIVLVPEIALTPQTIERFRRRFREKVALMHSRLLTGEKAQYWRMLRDGRAQIVIGARSAVFAPVSNLGLIVIDEEHEPSYKQKDTAPRYHAREVAILRAEPARAVVILGSATPSLESFYNAQKGKYVLLSLPERVTEQDLPKVSVVDMREEIKMRRKRVNILSRPLELGLEKILDRKEQAILFLNRRGFATFISCVKCGYTARCKRCQVCLTYHYADKTLVCHYCNYRVSPPAICPQCDSGYLNYFGIGTEKVESELHRLFPQARIARMDTDTTTSRDAHAQILHAFQEGEIDILVGTQMVAKGLDFPRVGLVGVVCADTALNYPDFRSAERTFNLLTQVGGRAGRGPTEGKVIIQTYVPQHYAILLSIAHDYKQFYQQELASRKALGLPPFNHLVNLTLSGYNGERVYAAACNLCLCLQQKNGGEGIQILGPAPAAVPKVRGKFYWNILLQGKPVKKLTGLIQEVSKGYNKYQGIPLTIDVDPL
ncbi:MAG: primosomal protein N' [Candidatus Omnitrophota bacterium]